MATTVLALFKERRDAEAALSALREAHFDPASMAIVQPGDAHLPRFGVAAMVGIAAGAVACAIVGVLVGLVAGGFVPGIHAWLPGGWFVPFMLGFAGAGTGAVAGMLMSQSIVDRGAFFYEDEVRAGRTLVSVQADPADVERARQLLLDLGAFDASPLEAPIRRRGFAG